MKLFAASLALAAPASLEAAELRDCDLAGFGLASLFTGENNENIRHFYEGRVTVLLLDQDEPACCSIAVAFLLPSGDGRAEPAFTQCQVVSGYAGLDVAGARASYDPARGLTLTIAAREYDNDAGGARAAAPLVVTIDAGAGTIRLGE